LRILIDLGYRRSPAKLNLQPFEKELARQFLRKGLEEYNLAIKDEMVNEAVERLDGTPGWLTLYGNSLRRHQDSQR